MLARTFTTHFLIERAPDVPGEWVAHCLDFDVISQGRSVRHAIEMLFEAVSMTLAHELQAGNDPTAHRAPEECWQRLYEIVRSVPAEGSLAELLAKGDAEIGAVAAVGEVTTLLRDARPSELPMAAAPRVPAVWASHDSSASCA